MTSPSLRTRLAGALHRRSDPGSGPGSGGFDRKLIAPMILGSMLNPVNSSMLAVALVPIGVAFGAPPAQTAWLVSGLYLATAIGQPVVGRLVDLYGPRRLFLAGTALVGLAGLLGALAPSLGVLVLARVLLGFGTCAGYPSAMYLIRREARRTGLQSPAGVLTALAVATQTVAVVGPSLGGLLIGAGGWRATLLVNVPVAVAGLVLGALRLPRERPEAQPGDARTSGLDVPGMALFAAALVALLLFLMAPGLAHWYLLLVAAGAAAALVWWELRAASPFVDLRLLAGNPPLLLTYLRALLAQLVAYAFLYGFPQWIEAGRGLSASTTGLVLLPLFGAALVVSALTGRRPEIRAKLLAGALLQAAACALLFLLGPATPVWAIAGLVAVMGVPQGLNNLANQNAVYAQAEPARIASSAGLLRTFSYLGAVGSAAVSGAFLGEHADTAGLHGLAVFLLVTAAAFALVTLADRSLARVGRPT